MLLATPALANPQLDPSNSTDFFTTVAMALFQQMDLHDLNGNLVTVTNIPIYEDPVKFGGTNINYYTPAVHRVLQLAANLFDATTNRFIGDGPTNYPTVFRPTFRSENGVASIIGYKEVIDPSEAFLPALNPWDFILVNQPMNSIINMYGVPWVIGAKKGFPNFNQFSMETALNVTRKLQFTNAAARPPWTTNQIYSLTISNTFGVGAWNSYTNDYGRPLRMIVTNAMSITITNEYGLVLLSVTNLSFGSDDSVSVWPGWSRKISDASFKIPLLISKVYTNAIYQKNVPMVIPLPPQIWGVAYQPHLSMVVKSRVRFILIDTAANRVVDFVNLEKTQPAVDVTSILFANQLTQFPDVTDLDAQWNTNLFSDIPIGILNQIQVSEGGSVSIWNSPNRAVQAAIFLNRLFNGGTNIFQAPYSPSRTIFQEICWQANDPLVHYTVPDLTSTNGIMRNYNLVSLILTGSVISNLDRLNYAYRPWGGYHLPGGYPLNSFWLDLDVRVKDPGVQQSDDWNFPAGESLGFEWLGRVHRGTPWQTVFLKPSNQSLREWANWNNDNILFTNGDAISLDAAFSHPNNDWNLASLWARWLNTNDLSTLLSVNNSDTNAWAARLDGLTALTNSAPGQLDALTIRSNSPQAGVIAQTIVAALPNHLFQDVGDVLSAPQLTLASPFINTNGLGNPLANPNANGVTDEALEKIPTQLLPLLRADSFGKIVPVNGQFVMSFSGYDDHSYRIEASSNLTDWVILSTNSPSDGNFGVTNDTTSDQQFYRSVLLH